MKIIPIRQDTADFDDPHFTGNFHLQLKPDYTGGEEIGSKKAGMISSKNIYQTLA